MRRPYQFRVSYKDSENVSGHGFQHVYALADAQKWVAHFAAYKGGARFSNIQIETRAADGTWQAL